MGAIPIKNAISVAGSITCNGLSSSGIIIGARLASGSYGIDGEGAIAGTLLNINDGKYGISNAGAITGASLTLGSYGITDAGAITGASLTLGSYGITDAGAITGASLHVTGGIKASSIVTCTRTTSTGITINYGIDNNGSLTAASIYINEKDKIARGTDGLGDYTVFTGCSQYAINHVKGGDIDTRFSQDILKASGNTNNIPKGRYWCWITDYNNNIFINAKEIEVSQYSSYEYSVEGGTIKIGFSESSADTLSGTCKPLITVTNLSVSPNTIYLWLLKTYTKPWSFD